MEPYKYRILFCVNDNEGAKSSCQKSGCDEVLEALKSEILKKNLRFVAKITKTNCLGICAKGPNLVVLPEGVWYSDLNLENVPEFVEQQLIQNHRYEPKVWADQKLKDFFECKISSKKEK